MNFQERYEKIKVLAKPELEIIEKNLIEDVHTREPLNSALKNFLTAPSKRIRPLLSILYLKANEENFNSFICRNFFTLILVSVKLIYDNRTERFVCWLNLPLPITVDLMNLI